MSKANQRVIVEELARVGLEPHAIAGILANLEYENSFRTTVNNGDGGAASGIAQWHPDRFARVERVARKMKVPPTDIRAQARTLALSIVDERQSGPTGTVDVKALNSLNNPAAVAQFFDENYERSDGSTRKARMQAAKKYTKIAARAGKGASGASAPKTFTWVEAETGHNYNTFHEVGAKAYANPKQWHTGNDIGAPDGSPIQWAPPVDGKVIEVNQGGAYGPHWAIVEDEKGREWLFAHMSGTPLKVGQKLTQGDRVGQTGQGHLHLEQTRPGKGGWEYDDPTLKAPKLKFVAKGDYKGGDGSDISPDMYASSLGVAKSWLDNPGMDEIKTIVKKAAANDWTQDKFMWAIRDTDWYMQRSESQRKFDMMQSRDQSALLDQSKSAVKAMAKQFGVVLTKEQIEREAFRIARDGDTPEMQQAWLARKYKYDPNGDGSGLAATFQEQLQASAADFGVKLSDHDLQQWTRQALAKGDGSPDDFTDNLRERAQALFPWLDLSNKTTRQALSAHLQVASNELDVDPSTIDLTDPKWVEVLDPQSEGLMSTEDWRKKIVTDKRYGWEGSKRGKQASASLATSLGRIFGGLT